MSIIAHIPLEDDLSLISGTGPLIFDRSGSEALYRSPAGVLTLSPSVGGDVQARLEKDGLLVEGSSTNLSSPSEIGNPSFPWAVITGTASQTDPLGGSNAFLNTDTNLTTAVSFNVASPSTYSCSVFVKESTVDNQFGFGEGTFGPLANGVILDWVGGFPTLNTFVGDASNLKVESYVGDWFRLIITIITTGNISSVFGRESSQGGGTLFYGFDTQAVESSHIITTSNAVVRVKESVEVPTTNLPSDADFTISVNADISNTSGTDAYIVGIGHTGSTSIRFDSLGRVVFTYNGTSSSPVIIGPFGTNIRLTLTYNKATALVSGYVNGAKVITDLAVTPQAAAITDIFLGSDEFEGSPLFGHVTNFRTYDTALTDREVSAELWVSSPLTTSEAMSETLKGLGFLGGVSEMQVSWLESLGAISGSLDDRWKQLLDSESIPDGGMSERQKQYYGAEAGNTGLGYNESKRAFWLQL